jgi:hypothetical protein
VSPLERINFKLFMSKKNIFEHNYLEISSFEYRLEDR